MNCGTNHSPKSYSRNNTGAPGISCVACHSTDEFNKNSKHPILKPGANAGLTIICETCHNPDHSTHNATNPKGLNLDRAVTWTSTGTTTGTETFTFSAVIKDFCWNCHGNSTTRTYGTLRTAIVTNLGDQESKFADKPHATLERQGTANPYGTGNDISCMECHVNHGSSNTHLLKSVIDGTPIDSATDAGKINACMACHDGAYGTRVMSNISSLYNAPKFPGHYFKGTKTKLLCTECHSPHGTDNPEYILSGLQATGANFPTTMATMDVCRVCSSCHPFSDQTQVNYSSTTGTATMYPLPNTIAEHASTSGVSCALCHDPHKPWPATGSNGLCYTCHGNGGEAQDNVEELMGTTSISTTGQIAGILSFHKIYDANTPNTNDCMNNCHSTHPHDPRADHIPGTSTSTANNEKELCLKCHDSVTVAAIERGQPKIIAANYVDKPHDYFITSKLFNDGSSFQSNCNKCHQPHGSSYTKLLKWQNGDSLCTQCHDGQHKDGNGAIISNIKTMYTNVGHYYKADTTMKLRCDECHIPHGSTNVKYLRDDQVTGVINADNSVQPFPQNMTSLNYSSRDFCITCHIANNNDGTQDYRNYTSTSGPVAITKINELPIVTEHFLTVDEHRDTFTTSCTNCHNAHDPRPVGSNKDCFKCHGNTGYAFNIQTLTGIQEEVSPGVYKDFVGREPGILSSHRIWDGDAIGTNTCMLNCHQAHVHNPRSDLIRDRRLGSGDITAPGVPTGLLATAKGTTRVDLQWSAPADLDIQGYYIYTSTDGTNFSKTGVTGNTTFIDGGLTPNVQVWYKVTAYDKSVNESGFSNVVNATPNLASDTLAPTVPTNLVISAKTTTTIRLAWSKSTDNVEVRGYKVYRSTDDVTYTLMGITGETVFTDGGLTPNTRYYYKVSAYDSKSLNQESAFGDPVNDVTAANTNTTKGLYTGSGGDKVEFLLGTTNTTSFATGNTVKIKLTSTRLANANNLRNTTIFDYKGTQIARYTTATVTKSTSPYEIETTFTAPTTPGVYTVWVNWTSSSNASISTYETIVVGSTVQWIKTYKDANRTVETRDFGPTDTVYIKAFTTQGTASLSRSYWTFGRWGGTAGTQTGTFSAVTMSGDYALYSINLTSVNTVTKTTGEWYYLRGLIRDAGSVILSSLYYMIRIQPPDVTAPNLPGVPTGTAASDTSINLSWTASSSTDVVGYNVFRSMDGTNYYKADATTTTTFTDKGLFASTGYLYKVTAYDASGNGNTVASATSSNMITTAVFVADAVKPSAPNGLTATGNGAIVLSWTASSDNIGVSGYSIYRSADGGVTFLKAGSTTATEFVDTGLVTAKPYTYYVEAFDAAGNTSLASLQKTATEHSTTTDSMERALCMICHDGTGANVGLGLDPARTNGPNISTAYNGTKHNVDSLVDSFSDGSEYYGNCTKCHEPHGSNFPYLLKWANDNNLCFNCHTNASSSGKYGGKRDYELSVHGLTSEPGDVSKAVWAQTHSTVFSDHFGTLSNWNVNYGTGVGASTLITANEGQMKVSQHSAVDNTWVYAYAETNASYSIANGISMYAELNLPSNPVVASRDFTSDFYITDSLVSVQTGKNPANGANWIRVRYDQSPSGTKVYVDKRISSGAVTNLYTDTSFKSYAKKERNVRIILNPSQLIVYDGPTLLVTANSLGLPSGSNYYLDLGSSSNTTEALTTKIGNIKWHDNTKGVNFITQEGGNLRGGWKVEVYASPSNTLLTSVTTSNIAGATFGQGTIGTQANNQLVYFKLYDNTLTLKDTSAVRFITPDDTWTSSYETVADSYTPRLFRGRVDGEEGVCKNCHVTHGRLDIYGQTIRAASVTGTSTNINELCFACHTNDTQLGSYPGNEVYKRDTHYWEAQLDASYGKGECANCHDPHGTPYGFLLRYPVNTDAPDSDGNSRKNELCAKCHDLAAILNETEWFKGSTFYNAASNADHGKYAQWPADQPENRGDFIPGVCLNCHNAHGKDDGSGTETNTRKMLPVADTDNNNICYKCHDNSVLAQAADLMGNGPYTNRAPGWPTVFNSADGTVTIAGSIAYKAGAHEKSGVKPTVWPSSATYPALTLAEDGQCINCHDPHGSWNPSGLLAPTATTLCLTCHNGTQATSVNMSQAYGHKTSTPHSLTENWGDGTVTNHAICSDCHKVHELKVTDKLYGIDGIDITGATVSPIDPNLQYQLCLKCHSAFQSRTAAMLPGTGKLDLRQQFLTTNGSHHGVMGRVVNTYITVNNMSATGAAILNRAGGLPAGTPVLRCSDCHDYHTGPNADSLKWPFGTTAEKKAFCKQCHSPYIYDGSVATGAPPAGTKSGYDHRGRNAHYNNTVGGCMACHGGGKNTLVYGGIHGGNVTFGYGAGKRFIGGTYINNWKVGTCVTTGGCNNHSETYGVKTF